MYGTTCSILPHKFDVPRGPVAVGRDRSTSIKMSGAGATPLAATAVASDATLAEGAAITIVHSPATVDHPNVASPAAPTAPTSGDVAVPTTSSDIVPASIPVPSPAAGNQALADARARALTSSPPVPAKRPPPPICGGACKVSCGRKKPAAVGADGQAAIKVSRDYDVTEHALPVAAMASHAFYGASRVNAHTPAESVGLTAAEAAARLITYGRNEITPPPEVPQICVFLLNFLDPFMIVSGER